MVVFEEKFRLSPVTRWEILKTGSETRANQQTRDKGEREFRTGTGAKGGKFEIKLDLS